MMKKREYGDRVQEVELASFTPLVFSTTGGMGREGTVFYWWLANLLASKQDWAYGTTISWVRCVLSSDLPLCVQGSRSISFRSSFASAEMGLVISPLMCKIIKYHNCKIILMHLICWIIVDDFYFVMIMFNDLFT